MPPEVLRWQELRRTDVARLAADPPPVIVPLGSVEQHGDHLPLDTDSFTVQAVALRAAVRAPFPVLVAPTVWWGVSEYWMAFPGTIAIAPDTLEALLVEVCTSIGRHGFSRIVLLNGHAGNTGALHGAAVRLASAGIRAVGLHYWSVAEPDLARLSRADRGRIGHAGEIETSLQLYLRPEAVGQIPESGVGTSLPRSILPPSLAEAAIVPPDPAVESPSGIYGDPSGASAELGAAVLDAVVDGIVEFLAALRESPLVADTRSTKR